MRRGLSYVLYRHKKKTILFGLPEGGTDDDDDNGGNCDGCSSGVWVTLMVANVCVENSCAYAEQIPDITYFLSAEKAKHSNSK